MFNFDISKEFAELKKANTCTKCDKLIQFPITLKTCGHLVCKPCLKGRLRCPKCLTNFIPKDADEIDPLALKVIDKINKIDKLFESSSVENYCIENLPLDLFSEQRNTEKINEPTLDKPITQNDDTVEWLNDSEFVCPALTSNVIKVINKVVKKNNKGETPLHLACKRMKIDQLNNLINSSDVDVNAVDWANWTPLHEAVQSGSEACVRALIKAGALVNIPGEYYTTVLHQAVQLGNCALVKILLSGGADPNLQNYSGKKPCDMTVSEEIKELLKTKPAKPEVLPKYFIQSNNKICISEVAKETIDLIKSKGYVSSNAYSIFNKDTFMLLLGKDETVNTLPVLAAILKGIIVIRETVLEQYLASGFPLQPNLIPSDLSNALKSAILNRLKHCPNLFNGMNFHITGHTKQTLVNKVLLKKENIVELIKLGGGKLLVRAPTERTAEVEIKFPYHANGRLVRCCHYIIYDESEIASLRYNMPELRHVTSSWLIDCILNYKIIDF